MNNLAIVCVPILTVTLASLLHKCENLKTEKWMSDQVPKRFRHRLDKYFNGLLESDVINMSNNDLVDACLQEDRICMVSFLSSWRRDPIILWASGVLLSEGKSLGDFMRSITANEKPHVVSLVLSNNNLNVSDVDCLRLYLRKSLFPRLSLLNMKGNNVDMTDLAWIKTEFPHIIILTDPEPMPERPPVWPTSSSATSDSEEYC